MLGIAEAQSAGSIRRDWRPAAAVILVHAFGWVVGSRLEVKSGKPAAHHTTALIVMKHRSHQLAPAPLSRSG
jgi:hypothetical protein